MHASIFFYRVAMLVGSLKQSNDVSETISRLVYEILQSLTAIPYLSKTLRVFVYISCAHHQMINA